MTEGIGDRVNAGMRALGSAVGKTIGQAQTQGQTQGQGQTPVATAGDAEKVTAALNEIAHAIDRLTEAVRGLKG